LSPTKGRQRHVFRLTPGRKPELLAALVGFAERPGLDFDSFDATLLGNQRGKRIGNTAECRVAAFP
jgi:hypothetical protein